MSDSGPTISENATDAADSSVTFNHSAAAETGMFGYAAGQVVQGNNDRLYSHAFIIGEVDKNASKRVVYVSADMGAMFTAVKLEVIKPSKSGLW